MARSETDSESELIGSANADILHIGLGGIGVAKLSDSESIKHRYGNLCFWRGLSMALLHITG